ncbi:MAG: hypothetical protein U1A77_25180 [Pirellulales bacterium]
MQVQCPRCRVVHAVDDRMAGTRAQCTCGAAIDIPRPASAAPQLMPAATRRAAAPAAAPSGAAIRCPRCQAVHAVTPAMQGTHARCGCGNMLWIPPAAGARAPAGPAPGMPGSGMQQAGMPVGPAPFQSLLDELTHSDLGVPSGHRPASQASSGHGSPDALRKFLDKDKDTRVLPPRPISISLQIILRMVGFTADFSLAALSLYFLITWSDEGGTPTVGKAKYAIQASWCVLGLLLGGMGFHGLTSREPWGWHVTVFGNGMLIAYQFSMVILAWATYSSRHWFGLGSIPLIPFALMHNTYLFWTVLDHLRGSVRTYYGFKESLLKAVIIVWMLAAFFGLLLTGGIAFLIFFVI